MFSPHLHQLTPWSPSWFPASLRRIILFLNLSNNRRWTASSPSQPRHIHRLVVLLLVVVVHTCRGLWLNPFHFLAWRNVWTVWWLPKLMVPSRFQKNWYKNGSRVTKQNSWTNFNVLDWTRIWGFHFPPINVFVHYYNYDVLFKFRNRTCLNSENLP